MDLSDVLSRTYFTNEIWEGSIFINMIKVHVIPLGIQLEQIMYNVFGWLRDY